MEIKHQAIKEYALWSATNALPGKHRRGSGHTIRGYLGDLELFADWFNETTGLDLSAETLTPDDIQDYITFSQTVEKRKPNTILRRFAAIRSYCLYLLQTNEFVTSDLTTGIRLPKKPVATKRGLRRLERLAVKRVFNIPEKNTTTGKRRNIRNKAIVLLMMYTGVRVEELSNITVPDILSITPRQGEILIPDGKGGKARSVGIPSDARPPLIEWIELRKTLGVEHEYLFVTLDAKQAPLKKRAVQTIVEKVGERAKLEDIKLTAHILRHTAVRIWREKTTDRITAAQMGHSIATMQRYDALKTDDVRKAASNF